MTEVSEPWAKATLKELISADGMFSDGDWIESKDQDPQGAIRLLQLADIGDGNFLNKSNRFINDEKFEKLRCTELQENDVLIARMPDPLGRACLMPSIRQRCVTVVDVAIVRPGTESVRPKWLMHFLNSPAVRQEIEIQSSGTTRRRISRGNLSNIELPIPPLPEQIRIADKLDNLLARVDACRDRLDRIPTILKRFRQAVLATATDGRLTEGWRLNNCLPEPEQVTIGDVMKVSSGKFLPAKDMTVGGKVPVFGGNGINGYHDKSNVDGETLVIGRVGFYCGSVHMTPSRAWVTDNALIVRHDEKHTLKRFLYFSLQATDLRANNSSTAQPVISGAKIYPTPILVPHIAEQTEIVRRVESLFAFADRLETRYAAARAQVEKLTPSLLAKAFRGELVPQDPDDEPASVLLERLRAAVQPAPKTRRGRKAVDAPDRPITDQ